MPSRSAVIPPQLLEVSPLQLRWLVARMDTGTDAAASRILDDLGEGRVSKGTLRHWKRSSTFSKMLGLVKQNKDEAFRALVSGSMATLAFEALRGLLTGDTPYERVQGLRAYMDITKNSGVEGSNVDELLDRIRKPDEVRVLAVYKRDGLHGGPTKYLGAGDGPEYVEGEYVDAEEASAA